MNNLTKFDDYTKDSGLDDQLTAKTSLLNSFRFIDSIAIDQQFEDIPFRKVSAADSNTGTDVFGRIETTRTGEEGFYRIVLPINDYVALGISTSVGGAGGSVTSFVFGEFQMYTGAAPGGNLQTIVPGYPYVPDMPTSNQGAGYLWVDGAAANVIKMGT